MTTYAYGTKTPTLLDQGGLPVDTKADHGFNNRGDVLNLSPMLLEKYFALSQSILDHPQAVRRSKVLRHLLAEPFLLTVSHFAGLTALCCGLLLLGYRLTRTIPAVAIAAALAAAGLSRLVGLLEWTFDWELTGWGMLSVAIAAGFGDARRSDEHDARVSLARVWAGRLVYLLSLVVICSGRGLVAGGIIAIFSGFAAITLGRSAIRGLVGWLLSTAAACLLAILVLKIPTELDLQATRYAIGRVRREFLHPDLVVNHVLFGAAFVGVAICGLLAAIASMRKASRVRNAAWAALACSLLGIGLLLPDPPVRMLPMLGQPLEKSSRQREFFRSRLADFTSRAFRTSVDAETVERFLAIYDRARDDGRSYDLAVKNVITAVLCSPSFLYRVEEVKESAESVRPLDDDEVATRLSYFLWSSMPDEARAIAR